MTIRKADLLISLASARHRRAIPVIGFIALAGLISIVLIRPALATSNNGKGVTPATAGGVAAAGGRARTAARAPVGYTVTGIDVSKWQGTVNWTKVAASDQFAYVKATEGATYLSDTFAAQYTGAKAAGMYVGAYAFGRPDSAPILQADYFIHNSGYAADGQTLPPMLDLEWPYQINGKYVAPYPCFGRSPAQMVTWIRTFVTEVRRLTGSPTMIYTTGNWWNGCTGNSTEFADQLLDVASYSAAAPTTLPSGFAHWTLWQYASSGSLPGDQDVFTGTLDQLAAMSPAVKCSHVPDDFNGDGYADLAVGEPGRTVNGHAGAGAVRVFYGGPAGLSTSGGQFIDLDATGVASTTSAGFGTAVAAGFYDGGCYSDLAVSAPGLGDGTVTILHGGPTGLSTTGAIQLTGRTSGSRFGAALASGDLTGDGVDDLAIGAANAAGRAGEIAVATGSQTGPNPILTWIDQSTTGVPGTSTAADQFGAALAIGDVNRDGYADLAVGVPGKLVSGHAGAGEVIDLRVPPPASPAPVRTPTPKTRPVYPAAPKRATTSVPPSPPATSPATDTATSSSARPVKTSAAPLMPAPSPPCSAAPPG